MLLTGYTKDKEGNAIAGAVIEVKDRRPSFPVDNVMTSITERTIENA